MRTIFLLCFFTSFLSGFSQSDFKSIMREQSEFYSAFKFTNDNSWDSLNTIINGSSPSGKSNHKTAACNLTKKVFGWHPYWVGSVYTAYDWNMLSDFCYFDYAVSPTTGQNTNTSFAWSTSAAVTAAKANGKKIHICATLFAAHSTFWASSTAQTTFINNIVSLLNSRGGNGVNIDFEGMGSADKTPFKNFMINLKNALTAANPNYELSMALYAVEWSSTFDIPALNPIVTNFIIMGYDYYYAGSTSAGPESPLYNFQPTYNYTVAKSITYYLKQGVTASKLLLGLPYYGREWETVSATAPSSTTGNFTSSRTYSYVKNNPTTYSAANKKWESTCYNPFYVYLSGGMNRQCWIDDVYSMGRKYDLVNQRRIGGIGIWALGYDNGYNDLWQLIEDKFSNCAVQPCTDSLFDMGGPYRNYYDNEAYSYSIGPNGTSKVQLQFKSFALEQGYDTLFLYNGSSTAAPLIGAYTGTNSPGTVTSTGTVITIRFKSDVGVVNSGFKLIYNCVSATDINEAAEQNKTQMVIFPNPSSEWIYIKSEGDIRQIKLTNTLGEEIFYSKNSISELNLKNFNLPNGIYFLDVMSANDRQTFKIIYQN